MEKQCSKCNEVKPISEFGVLRGKVGGMSHCKVCNRKRGMSHFNKNKDKILLQNKIWKEKNPDKVKEITKSYYHNNLEFHKKRVSIYQKNNNSKLALYRKHRYNTNPEFHFMEQVRGHLKGVKNRQKFKDLWDDTYKMYDEKGIPYDIDHLIPKNWFLVRTPKHLINHLDNLQVIDMKYNRSKKDRWSDPVPSEYLDKVRPYIKKKFEGLLKSL